MWVLLEDQPKKLSSSIRPEIAERAKFLVDESLGSGVAEVIKELGWNVVFAPDAGLRGKSDEEVFAFAWKQNRVNASVRLHC